LSKTDVDYVSLGLAEDPEKNVTTMPFDQQDVIEQVILSERKR
jgi:hypothetical protein